MSKVKSSQDSFNVLRKFFVLFRNGARRGPLWGAEWSGEKVQTNLPENVKTCHENFFTFDFERTYCVITY